MSKGETNPIDFRLREEELRRRNATLEAKRTEIIRKVQSTLERQTEEPLPIALDVTDQISPSARVTRHAALNPPRQPSPAAVASAGDRSSQRGVSARRRQDSVETGTISQPQPIEVHDDFETPTEQGPSAGEAARSRYLAAKLKVMEQGMQNVQQVIAEKDRQTAELQQRMKELEEENRKLSKKLQVSQNQVEKNKILQSESDAKIRELTEALGATKDELLNIQKEQRKMDDKEKGLTAKLNRSLSEIEKYKDQLKEQQSSQRSHGESSRKDTVRLQAENKRLFQQRDELVAAFTKQMKLIDILKRQKMHMEAAKMLGFAEDEFSKILDSGERV